VGLQYVDDVEGTGDSPKRVKLTVHYTGTLTNGTEV
jgi:FKBP-type peptidyl-prolyl cis-trans isomerase